MLLKSLILKTLCFLTKKKKSHAVSFFKKDFYKASKSISPFGFTLIEAIIVMFILASSMTAALYLISTVVFSTQASINRTKAVYLAQECTELTRNLRDSAWINYQTWNCAFTGANNGDEFIISNDYTDSNSLGSCNGIKAGIFMQAYSAGSQNHKLFKTGSRIDHQPGTNAVESGYKRRLKLVESRDTSGDSNIDTLDLECLVEWQFNGQDESLVAPLTLTNWRRN